MQKPSECNQRRRHHFFKIIHSTQDPCMVIPNKFIRISGKELSNRVVLKVPSSKEWDIELREEEGRVSFQNGFQEFMEYYSIGRGHFLMFRYEGNSRFSVVICDMSASEISYPCDDADQIQEEDSMVVFKQNDVRQKKMVGTSKPVSLQCKKMAMKLAKEFTSKHPFCYVLMCPSYVSYNFVLTLPLCFSQKYLQGYTQSQNITLLVSEGRTWKVNCSCTTDRVRLVKGWKKFVLDNELEVGDTCIFELVDREKRELEVSIFRVLEDSKPANKSLDHSNSQTKDAIPQRKKKRSRYSDSSHSKKEPLQKISNLVSQATKDECTKRLCRLYLKDAFQGITLCLPNGGKWPISFCVGDHRKLLAGWKTFVVDNQLKEDDICIFELVDSKNIELKVFIFPYDP